MTHIPPCSAQMAGRSNVPVLWNAGSWEAAIEKRGCGGAAKAGMEPAGKRISPARSARLVRSGSLAKPTFYTGNL
jgi:hypothetical protein